MQQAKIKVFGTDISQRARGCQTSTYSHPRLQQVLTVAFKVKGTVFGTRISIERGKEDR